MIQIRCYQPCDRDAVLELHNTALHAVGAHAGAGPWDADLDRIEAVYLDDGGEFLVGILQGQIVAMGALKRTGTDRAEVKRMRVHPDFQRRGFGQAILTALEKRATELGYSALHLDTTILQTAAQRLYTKNGFKEVRRGQMAGFDCIFYEKRLAIDIKVYPDR